MKWRRWTFYGLTSLALTGVFIGLLQGCSKDVWYHSFPPGVTPQLWPRLANSRVFTVKPAMQSETVRLLSNHSAVKLSSEQAARFATGPYLPGSERTAYLVRAVYYSDATGSFQIRSFRDALWVAHYSLGGYFTRMKHRPLIVLLEGTPTQIYVTASMVE